MSCNVVENGQERRVHGIESALARCKEGVDGLATSAQVKK